MFISVPYSSLYSIYKILFIEILFKEMPVFSGVNQRGKGGLKVLVPNY